MTGRKPTLPPGSTDLPGEPVVTPLTIAQSERNRAFDALWRGSDTDDNVRANFITNLRFDVSESDTSFTIQTECPGVTSRDIKASFTDNVLTITVEKNLSSENETLHPVERSQDNFPGQPPSPSQVKSNQIKAAYEKGILTITKKFSRDRNTEKLHLVERSYGAFVRQIALPSGIDGDDITANFTNDILTIVLPKMASITTPPYNITIETA